jgi:hypothetical protein
VFGCPYNLHPERPWLRRTIRGMIATGVVVVSPLVVAGAVTAAVTVLPSIGIYKFVKHVRSRRHRHNTEGFLAGLQVFPDQDNEQQQELFQFDLTDGGFNVQEAVRILRLVELANNIQTNNENINEDFPLSIFADMDVENLFSEHDKPSSDFRTCPTTPAINIRQDHTESLDNLTTNH